jgi:hypothetical protein
LFRSHPRNALPQSLDAHMGRFGSRGEFQSRIIKAPAAVPVSKVRAHCMIWSSPCQIKLTFGRRSRRLHQYPACGGQGSGRRDHSRMRRFKPCIEAVGPPGSARTDQVLEDLRICRASVVRRTSSRLPR